MKRTTDNEIYGAFAQVAIRIWGRDFKWDVQKCHNNMSKFLNPPDGDHTGVSIDFDTADKILTRLGLATLWIADPEFSRLYRSVDLPTLDISRPTSKGWIKEVAGVYANVGAAEAGRVFGVSAHVIKRAVERAAEPVAA